MSMALGSDDQRSRFFYNDRSEIGDTFVSNDRDRDLSFCDRLMAYL